MNDAEKEKTAAAKASLVTACILTSMKLAVGLHTNSLGILSEALHSGLDLLAAGLTLFAVRLAARPADRRHPYGHGKIENLAALAETALLLLTCGWIMGEALDRLLFKAAHVTPSLWGVGVMGISIILDVHRARLLNRVAKKHKSQALEADALHFSSDVLSSSVVLVGLLLIWAGQYLPEGSGWQSWIDNADSVAALGVSLIVLHACYKLGRKALHYLMDGSSVELYAHIEESLRTVPNILAVRALRIRSSGAETFVDLRVCVPPRLSIQGGHQAMQLAEQRIQELAPGADVTIHIEPVAMSEENPLYAIQDAAAHHHIATHSLHIMTTPHGLVAELHAEMPADCTLRTAHRRVSAFEATVREYAPHMNIISHIEPEGHADTACPMPSTAHELAEVSAHIDAAMARLGTVSGCHRLRVYGVQNPEGTQQLSVSFHCRMNGEESIAVSHEAATRLERILREIIPNLGRVVIHMEPDPPDSPEESTSGTQSGAQPAAS